MNEEVGLEDIKEIDPDVYSNLWYITEYKGDLETDLC